jgi:hypothetical protein
MGIISRVRKQTAVYWPPSITFDKYGQPQTENPREISCRWDDVTEEFVDALGTRVVGRAIVMVPVEESVEVGGVLMLGTLDDLTEITPKDNEGAYEVRRIDETPNIRNTQTLVEAYL